MIGSGFAREDRAIGDDGLSRISRRWRNSGSSDIWDRSLVASLERSALLLTDLLTLDFA